MSRWNPPPFSCRVEPDGARPHVLVTGELDLATVDELDRVLHEVRDDQTAGLVLDLSRVTFLDSTGVSLVVRWANVAAFTEWDFSVRLGPTAEDVLALCGVLPRLRIYDGAAGGAGG